MKENYWTRYNLDPTMALLKKLQTPPKILQYTLKRNTSSVLNVMAIHPLVAEIFLPDQSGGLRIEQLSIMWLFHD